MIGKHPGLGEEYQDWEYPDPEEVEELANLPLDEEPPSSGGLRIPILLKIVGVLMLLAFVGSLLLPVLGSPAGSGDQAVAPSHNTAQEFQAYQQWIESSVSAALREWGAVGQARFLGVQFSDSIQDPVVGILAEGLNPRNGPDRATLQSYSIAVLQRLFADERAQSVTLAWLGPGADSGNDQSLREVILMVGMLRNTAQGIDLAHLRAEDLRKVADYYQETPPAVEESLKKMRLLDRL
ncbi:MAG: hypothetical protein ABID84_03265 [Chloroflexota bacterium]